MSGQKGRDVLIKIADGGDPETFVTVAGIRAKTISLNARTVDGTSGESPQAWRELIAGAGVKSASVSGAGVFKDANSDALMQQAFFTLRIPGPYNITVDAGKFVTPLGFEVIEAKDNWNYSRSLLFSWAVPYYHTGVRIATRVGDPFTVTVLAVNGWNSMHDNNRSLTAGLSAAAAFSSSTSLFVNVLSGVEAPDSLIAGKRTVVDISATTSIAPSISAAFNADMGWERTFTEMKRWNGVAAYVRWSIDSAWSVTLRGEQFRDPEGAATGLGFRDIVISEGTLTAEYRIGPACAVRGDFRYDQARQPLFDGPTQPSSERMQPSLLIGVIVSY